MRIGCQTLARVATFINSHRLTATLNPALTWHPISTDYAFPILRTTNLKGNGNVFFYFLI
jgi:hypothetical protein